MLARMMVTVGYDTVIATPHTFAGKPTPALINERLHELQHELNRQSIPLTLLPGSEPHIEPDLITALEKGDLQTLNNTSYFFIELPFSQPLPTYTEQLLFALTTKGYRPIIPHPERAEALQQDPQLLHRLHAAGALFQVTWGALTGWLGPQAEKLARYLLANSMAHLLATDAHNATSRLLSVKKAAAALDTISGPGTAAHMLTTRPRLLIANQTLDFPETEHG